MSMGGDAVARWLLTVVFAGTGLYYLARMTAAARHRRPIVDEALHTLMSAAMIAMWWSWGARVPAILYVTVFTAAVLWFVARVLFATPASGHTSRHGHHTWLWYHAGMMASMVWMAIAMSGTATTFPPGTGPAAWAGGGMTAMAGMDTSPEGFTGAGVMAMGTAPSWITVPCLILAATFGAATIWLATTTLRSAATRGPSPGWWPTLSNLAGTLMAAGMAVSFYEMF